MKIVLPTNRRLDLVFFLAVRSESGPDNNLELSPSLYVPRLPTPLSEMVVQKWKPIEEKVRPVTKSSNSPLLRQAHTHDPLSLSLVKQLQDTGELDY